MWKTNRNNDIHTGSGHKPGSFKRLSMWLFPHCSVLTKSLGKNIMRGKELRGGGETDTGEKREKEIWGEGEEDKQLKNRQEE